MKRLEFYGNNAANSWRSRASSDNSSVGSSGTNEMPSITITSDTAAFRREVDIWFTFRHPHVIQLFGACHVGYPFFVCEYATNGTLVSYLEKHPDELWMKLHEAALGEQYLHARNVVHGELKGNNIVVGSDKKAKVTDFGLSSLTEDADSAGISGASHWVAPECFQANARPTFESDIYSLGMCVIEALRVVEAVKAGKETCVCFPWGDLDKIAVKYHAKQGALPFRPEIASDEQWCLVTRMCALDPSKRIKISTVVDELARLANKHEDVPVVGNSLELIPGIVLATRDALAKSKVTGSLLSLYKGLWDRIEKVLADVNAQPISKGVDALYSLVLDAEQSIPSLLPADDSLVSVAPTTMQAFELRRRLDKFLDAHGVGSHTT